MHLRDTSKIEFSFPALRTKKFNISIEGKNRDNEVLGVTTLEQLGLQPDPVSKGIKPLPLYLM